jgi:hypothetical protein
MIIDKTVLVGIGSVNKQHFMDLGYDVPEKKDTRGRLVTPRGTKIEVAVEDLMSSSTIPVRYRCDNCGEEHTSNFWSLFTREESSYRRFGKTYCPKCVNTMLYTGENAHNYIHGASNKREKYWQYKGSAKRRGLSFDLTLEQFRSIVSKPCHYCGGNSKDYDDRSKGNGVDRKDSSKGYEIGNCVPCCWRCNSMKTDTPYQEFLDHVEKVYNHILKGIKNE